MNVKHDLGDSTEVLGTACLKAGGCHNARITSVRQVAGNGSACNRRDTVVADLLVEEAVTAADRDDQTIGQGPGERAGRVVRVLAAALEVVKVGTGNDSASGPG